MRMWPLNKPIHTPLSSYLFSQLAQPDHTGSMTTVHTSTSHNDINKNPTDADPDEVVVKQPYDEPPQGVMWEDGDQVSMDTDLTIDEGLFDQNGVKIGRKNGNVETGI